MQSIREILALVDPEKRSWGKTWATYTFTWLPLAANASAFPDSITTNNSSDFIGLTMRAYVTSTATPPVEVASPQATLILQLGSTILQPDNTPIPIAPYIVNVNKTPTGELAFPIYIPRNTEFTAQITDLSGVDSMVRIVIEGLRLVKNVDTGLQ